MNQIGTILYVRHHVNKDQVNKHQAATTITMACPHDRKRNCGDALQPGAWPLRAPTVGSPSPTPAASGRGAPGCGIRAQREVPESTGMCYRFKVVEGSIDSAITTRGKERIPL